MGTNTFHLLITTADEKGYRIIVRDRLAVKIGMNGITKGRITEDGIHRALLAMQSFKNTMDQHGVTKVYAFGTSALRNASNRHEVVQKIKAVTGIEANIISGDREAEYIFMGVKSAMHIEDKSLVMDIGGGSVEFIIGDNEKIYWKESFEIGAQRLLERFQKSDPIKPQEIAALDKFFSKSLATLFDALVKFKPAILIGSSGTFDTLSDMFCIQHEIHKSAEEVETPLTLDGFEELYRELIQKNRMQRMQIPGMIEMRVDMIVVACCLVRYVLSKHQFNRIRVSTYSLKEGVLASLITEINKENTLAV